MGSDPGRRGRSSAVDEGLPAKVGRAISEVARVEAALGYYAPFAPGTARRATPATGALLPSHASAARAQVRSAVNEYVAERKRAGMPAEVVLAEIKRLVFDFARRSLPDARAHMMATDAAQWCAEAYDPAE